MLSPKNSRSLILIFWPVTAPEQPRSNSMRKYRGIFPVVAAIFLIYRGALGMDVDSFGATPNNPAGSKRNYPEWISRAGDLSEACANKSLSWSAECALNVRQTSVCRGLIGKSIERNWLAFLPDLDKLEVCPAFGVA